MNLFSSRVRIFLLAAFAVIWAQAARAQTWDCGVAPGSVTATLSEDGTLTISGTGAMKDFYYITNMSGDLTDIPWHRRYIARVVIEDGVSSIGDCAFRACEFLEEVTIPNSVTSIGSNAFFRCVNLTAITIPESVTSIGGRAFAACIGLTSIVIPESVASIGDGAFIACSGLTSIVIPNSVASIGGYMFYGCYQLMSVAIGNSVDSIGRGAFGQTPMETIIIPGSVTFIGEGAFHECFALAAVVSLNPVPPTLHTLDPFNGLDKTAISLYVPESSIELYREDDFWGGFGNIKSIDEYVSVAARGRVIPAANPHNETAAIAPLNKLTAEFSLGPNPAGKSSGAVKFYYQGKRVKSGALTVYDASGSAVNKIIIRDDAVVAVGNGKRVVGLWNLTDKKGRLVPTGTYLVRGTARARRCRLRWG